MFSGIFFGFGATGGGVDFLFFLDVVVFSLDKSLASDLEVDLNNTFNTSFESLLYLDFDALQQLL